MTSVQTGVKIMGFLGIIINILAMVGLQNNDLSPAMKEQMKGAIAVQYVASSFLIISYALVLYGVFNLHQMSLKIAIGMQTVGLGADLISMVIDSSSDGMDPVSIYITCAISLALGGYFIYLIYSQLKNMQGVY